MRLAARVSVLGFEWLTARVRRLGFDGCLGFQVGLGFRGVRRVLGCRVKRARELGLRGVKKLGLGYTGLGNG